jgi:flagellar basal-body rod protein FlgF
LALTDNSSFFAVRGPDGDRYTRAGKLTLDGNGSLLTVDGHKMLGAGRVPIQVPTDALVTIDANGEVLANGEPTGQRVLVVTFPNVQGLIKEGGSVLRARPETGAAITVDPQIRAGALEMSNANALKSMSGMVTATRQFEMLGRVIDAFSQIERRAATDIARR